MTIIPSPVPVQGAYADALRADGYHVEIISPRPGETGPHTVTATKTTGGHTHNIKVEHPDLGKALHFAARQMGDDRLQQLTTPIATDRAERILDTLAAYTARHDAGNGHPSTIMLAVILADRHQLPSATAIELAEGSRLDPRVRDAAVERDRLTRAALRAWLAEGRVA